MIADTPERIEIYRLLTLKAALKLEIHGLKRRGRSVYSIIKTELGFHGGKRRVLKQLEAHINDMARHSSSPCVHRPDRRRVVQSEPRRS